MRHLGSLITGGLSLFLAAMMVSVAHPGTEPRTTAVQPTTATSLILELPGYWGHLGYTITGAQLDTPTGSDRGNVGGRQYKGKLAGNTLTISGTAVSDNASSGPGSGDYYELVVSVTVGKEHKSFSYIAPKDEKLSKPFSLSVPISRVATSGSFHISLLEQNANYGAHGWVVSGSLTKGPVAKSPAPAPPGPKAAKPALKPPTPAPAKGGTVQAAVEAELNEFINQFADTCFGKAIKLGDIAKYKEAMGNHLTIHAGDKAAKTALAARPKGGSNGYHLGGMLSAEIVLPFDPAVTKPTWKQQQTMLHEMTHHIEWTKGIKGDAKKDAVHAERNTKYIDAVVNELKAWQSVEARVKAGELSTEDALFRWNGLRQRLGRLELGYEGDPETGYTITARPDDNLKELYRTHWRMVSLWITDSPSVCPRGGWH